MWIKAKYDGPSNALEQFLRTWPGIDVRRFSAAFEPKVHFFENSLLKIQTQLLY